MPRAPNACFRARADITVSIEVPTMELAKTVDATARARRALQGARRVIEAARAAG